MYKNDKILLRAFTENDSSTIAEMRKDFVGQKAAGGSLFPSNEINEKEWISKMYPHGIQTSIYLAIEEVKTKQFIGYCSAMNINYINRNAHVGFFFHPNARGKGYFRESQILFYSYLFAEINLRKVYSYALAYNEIALKVDQQIGFQIDGVMKEHIYQNGEYHDAIILSLMAKDFFQINKSAKNLITR